MNRILEVRDLRVFLAGSKVLENISFSLEEGWQLAVIGSSGSGKTTLVKALSRQLFFWGDVSFVAGSKICVVSRQHIFNNLSNQSSFYYQQRFNSFDAEDSRTVEQELQARGVSPGDMTGVLELLGIAHVRHSGLIQLSNGEHKRFQIAEALLEKPDWIIMDSPYIGLDVQARKMLNEVIDQLVQKGMHILLVTDHGEMPSSITHVAILEKGKLGALMEREQFDKHNYVASAGVLLPDVEMLKGIPLAYDHPDFDTAVRMEDVSVRYGDKQVLDNINWEVKRGECWLLSGHNGSGKSTLLSLVNGDNPQAFANKIWIFDRRKGTGESIWDIKRNIGYISPELHHYFESGTDCLSVVASGLFDTAGLFRKLNEQQHSLAMQWMKVMGVESLAGRMFDRLSDSEQRRVLLARALVKNPPVLILDEPCQGMDDERTAEFNALINMICTVLGKTLVYVTHYEAELPACVTRKLVLSGGRISSVQ